MADTLTRMLDMVINAVTTPSHMLVRTVAVIVPYKTYFVLETLVPFGARPS